MTPPIYTPRLHRDSRGRLSAQSRDDAMWASLDDAPAVPAGVGTLSNRARQDTRDFRQTKDHMTQQDGPSRPPLVLIGIDQEWGARSLDSLLAANGFAVLRAHTGAQTLELAITARPDAVILDWKLADLDGVDVCRTLRASSQFNLATPLFLTATESSGRAQRLAAFDAGAWQFCTQPLDGEALLHQLRTFIQGKRACDDLSEQSLVDQRTGLYNFRGLARRAREIGAEATRLSQPVACLVIAPTDRQSPGRADQSQDDRALDYLADLLRRCGRLSDATGRLGQLEFAVVAPSTTDAGARRLANRLRETVINTPLVVDSAARKLDIQTGYCAISNFAQSSVDGVEILMRATTALRYARARPDGLGITSFDDLPARPR